MRADSSLVSYPRVSRSRSSSASVWSSRSSTPTVRGSSTPVPFSCRWCRAAYVSPAALDAHVVRQHPELYLQERRACQPLRARRPPQRRRKFQCPSNVCGRQFAARSGLVKHLESGECNSGYNRERVDQAVAGAGRNVQRELVNHAYARVPPHARIRRATPETSWDGHTRRLHCFLCGIGWPSMRSLNAHLANASHPWREDLYTCPDESCGLSFGLFSALMKHLESKSCDGHQSTAGMAALKTAWHAIIGATMADREI